MRKKDQTIDKIMQASLTEFANKGYLQASTNAIAEKAQVSKGLIFKYFPKKKDLYLALVQKVLKEMVEGFSNLKYASSEPILKIIDIIYWKAEYSKAHPLETALLLTAFSDPPGIVVSEIMGLLEQLKTLSFHQFFDDIDYTRYEKRFSKIQVQKNIELAIEGLQSSILKKGLTLDKLTGTKEESLLFIKTVLKGMEE
ncbi:MAG: TetR/AcrR family transcriptional regulator [Bacilli bacterium]